MHSYLWCIMTCFKWLRVLNVPLKLNHVLFLIILKHYIVASSFDDLFGLTWRMLTPCYDYKQSHLSPWWSFSFRLVISLYALINDVLSLCMIMAAIALLVGCSQSLASLHPVLNMSSTCENNSQKKVCQMCISYLPICCISPPLQVDFSYATFKNLQNY